MTRIDILRDRKMMVEYNLYCYSDNLLMTRPKPGYEQKWKECNEELEILETWIKEME